MGDGRLQCAIHPHSPRCVNRYACLLQTQLPCVGTASRRDHEFVGSECLLATMTQSREGHSLAYPLDPTYLCQCHDADPFLLQNLGERLGDFWLVARQNALAARDKRDLGPKAGKHLTQFQGDVAAAQNEQRARLFPQFGFPGIISRTQEIAGQIGNVSQSHKGRNLWG